MSTLSSLSIRQEKNLYNELHSYLSVDANNEIEVWPNEFLKNHKIIQDLTERELKILDINYWSLMKKLAQYKPKLLFAWDVEDTRYDFPDWPKQVRETIRIRRKNSYLTNMDEYYLTIKKKNISKEIKEREEFEVPITNIEQFDRMFRTMNLHPLHIKEKVRSSYAVEDVIMDIDLYYHRMHDIPAILEIEWKNKAHIMNRIRKLDLEKKKIVNWSSRQLLRFYDEWPTTPKKDKTKKIIQ